MHTLVPRARCKQWRKIMHCGGAHCEPESCDIEFGQLRAFVFSPLTLIRYLLPFNVSVFFRPSYAAMFRIRGGGSKGRTLDFRPDRPFSLSSLYCRRQIRAEIWFVKYNSRERRWARHEEPWKSLFPAADFSFFLFFLCINRRKFRVRNDSIVIILRWL